MNIFEKIADTSSMTQINRLIENLVAQNYDNPAMKQLQLIYKSDNLDERHLIAHEWLGNQEEAQVLKTWIQQKTKFTTG